MGSFPAIKRAAFVPANHPPAVDPTYPSVPVIWPAKKSVGRARHWSVGKSSRGLSRNVVAMHLTEPDELRFRQTRNHPQHSLLCVPFHVGLEAHQIVERARDVILAKLDHCKRTLSRSGIAEAYRTHGAKRKRIRTPLGQHLDRKASLEIASGLVIPLELVQVDLLGCIDSIDERVVLIP